VRRTLATATATNNEKVAQLHYMQVQDGMVHRTHSNKQPRRHVADGGVDVRVDTNHHSDINYGMRVRTAQS